MTSLKPLAILIDSDRDLLSKARSALEGAQYQTIARLSARGSIALASILRPDVLLLGGSFWDRGWAQVFRMSSPDSAIFPLGDSARVRGALSPQQLGAFFTTAGGEGSHAA